MCNVAQNSSKISKNGGNHIEVVVTLHCDSRILVYPRCQFHKFLRYGNTMCYRGSIHLKKANVCQIELGQGFLRGQEPYSILITYLFHIEHLRIQVGNHIPPVQIDRLYNLLHYSKENHRKHLINTEVLDIKLLMLSRQIQKTFDSQ